MSVVDHVSRALGLGVVYVAMTIGVLSGFAIDDVERAEKTSSGKSREKLGLDLSFAKLKTRMIQEKLGSEAVRDAMAGWSEEHASEISALRAGLRQKRKDELTSLADLEVPQAPPMISNHTDVIIPNAQGDISMGDFGN